MKKRQNMYTVYRIIIGQTIKMKERGLACYLYCHIIETDDPNWQEFTWKWKFVRHHGNLQRVIYPYVAYSG